MTRSLPRLLLLALLAFPAALLLGGGRGGSVPGQDYIFHQAKVLYVNIVAVQFVEGICACSSLLVAAQDATEDEETLEAMEDTVVEDEDDEAEVEEDEPTELTEDKEEEDLSGEPKASPNADTTILFVKGEDFPANNIVKFLVGFTNKGTEDFIVESLDASFRYPQDYQFFIQNFTALPLNTVVPPQRQATFEYSFIPAEPMGGRPFGLVINLNYKDQNGNFFQDAVFNQTVTIIEKEDGLDGET
uniref:SWI/SNF and RSC complex subunit Ssr1 n=1 Tax=Sphaerodactylus townsendi TaxID=933632 RepID=A0ACB8FCQ2_9SAUR